MFAYVHTSEYKSSEDKPQVLCDFFLRPCCRCSRRLRPGGEGEGGMGEGAAEGGGSASVPVTALSQQRALGGDHGGGRLQTHRIPRQR